MGSKADTQNWTLCRVRESVALSAKWDVFIKHLYNAQGSIWKRRRKGFRSQRMADSKETVLGRNNRRLIWSPREYDSICETCTGSDQTNSWHQWKLGTKSYLNRKAVCDWHILRESKNPVSPTEFTGHISYTPCQSVLNQEKTKSTFCFLFWCTFWFCLTDLSLLLPLYLLILVVCHFSFFVVLRDKEKWIWMGSEIGRT